MKVALLTSDFIAEDIKPIVENEIDYVDLDIYIYKDYIEVLNLMEGIQKKYDGIMFAGIISYYLAKRNIKQETIWEYFKLHESCILRTLFQAQYFRKNIKKVSIDTYSEANVEKIYHMLGIDLKDINIKIYELNLENYKNINEEALEFHKKNIEENEDVCIITALSKVHEELNKINIDNYMAIPTENVIKDSFERLYLKYISKINKNSQIVSIQIEIDLPSEYSLISKNQYYYVKEKNKVSDIVYKFATDIEATIVEVSFNTYLLFTTKEILERKTNNFNEFDLMKTISKESIHVLSMGIGYGKSAIEARYNANLAILKASKINKNAVYVMYEDKTVVGPIYGSDNIKEEKLNDKLEEIAIKTNLSINKILKIYQSVDKFKLDTFTSEELSKYCGICIRSMNRILNKLEEGNYIEVVGKEISDGPGRPKRIMKINF